MSHLCFTFKQDIYSTGYTKYTVKFRQYALGVYTDKGRIWGTYIQGALYK